MTLESFSSLYLFRDDWGVVIFLAQLIGLGCILNTLRVRQFYSFLFASQELMSMTMGLGALGIIIGLYGLIAPCCFVGERTNHDRLLSFFMITFTGAMVIVSVFVQVRGTQRVEAETALDFGWHASYRDEREQHKIEVAQVEYDCCGFYDKKAGGEVDRGVMPCPADSSGGCSGPLVEEHMTALQNTAGLIYAGVLVGILTILCLLGYLQRAAERKKTLSANHSHGGSWEGVDGIDHEDCNPLSQRDNDGFLSVSMLTTQSRWDADMRPLDSEEAALAADGVAGTEKSPTKLGRDDVSVSKSASKRSARSNGSRHRRPTDAEP